MSRPEKLNDSAEGCLVSSKSLTFFLFLIIAALVSAGVIHYYRGLGSRAGPGAQARPNILLFIGDDWARIASCYQDPARAGLSDVVSTPNIDRLARDGVLFRNAFYNVSSCTPSRATIATGCYFWRLGRHAFHSFPAEMEHKVPAGWAIPGFGSLLRSQNFFLGSWGKTLHRFWFPAEHFPIDTEKIRYGRWVLAQPDRAAAIKAVEAVVRASVTEMLAKRPPGQPFCHVIGPMGAHAPFSKGSGRALWNLEPDSLKAKIPAFLPDVPEVREYLTDAIGEVLALDLYVGWIVDELKKTNELDNTLLVLTGDNGLAVPRGKTQVYDYGMCAPLIVHWPAGIRTPGRVVDDFVSLVDLAPTFLEAAGADVPKGMNGRSLMPLLKSDKAGQIDSTRDFVTTGRELHDRNVRNGLPYPVRAIRTAQFLYVRNFKPERWPHGDPTEPHFPGDGHGKDEATLWILANRNTAEGKYLFDLNFGKRPAEELYDLRLDPDETRNIALESAYAEPKRTLSGRLDKILHDTHDPRLTDDFDRPPYYSPASAKTLPDQASNNDDLHCLQELNEE